MDISKTLIFDFHYNIIKNRYGEKSQLQYTDTDSLTYLIKTDNVYSHMNDMLHLLDTSNYPEPKRDGIPRINNSVIGKLKNELSGRIMFQNT